MLQPCLTCDNLVVASCRICIECMLSAKLNATASADTLIGYLIDADFYCPDCASWFENITDPARVSRQNLGGYSQICALCNTVVYCGGTGQVLYRPVKPRKAIGA